MILSKPLLEKSHLELITQDNVQVFFLYFQGWILHKLPGQHVRCLVTLTVFPDVQRPHPESQVEPIASYTVPYFSTYQDIHKNLIHLICKANGGGIHLAKDIMETSTSELVSTIHS